MRKPYALIAIVGAFALFTVSTAEAQPCPKNTPRDKHGRPLNKNCARQQPSPVFFPGFGAFGGGPGPTASAPGSSRSGTLATNPKSGGSGMSGGSGGTSGGSSGGSSGGRRR
jgi:hypothetical protein